MEAVLLATTPVTCAVADIIPLVTHRYVQVFGRNPVGETNLNYPLPGSTLILDCSTGWHGIPPKSAGLYNLRGITIARTVVTLTGDIRRDAILSIRIQWWLALLARAGQRAHLAGAAFNLIRMRNLADG